MRVDRPAEFPAPDDERLVEQAALLEVLDQTPAGLIDILALAGHPTRNVGVMVPVVVIDLNEPYSAFDHPPGLQGGVGEGSGFAGLFAVERKGGIRLVRGDR